MNRLTAAVKSSIVQLQRVHWVWTYTCSSRILIMVDTAGPCSLNNPVPALLYRMRNQPERWLHCSISWLQPCDSHIWPLTSGFSVLFPWRCSAPAFLLQPVHLITLSELDFDFTHTHWTLSNTVLLSKRSVNIWPQTVITSCTFTSQGNALRLGHVTFLTFHCILSIEKTAFSGFYSMIWSHISFTQLAIYYFRVMLS